MKSAAVWRLTQRRTEVETQHEGAEGYVGWEQVAGKKRRSLQDILLVDVFLLEESHRQRSLVSYSPWGRTELDTTEVTWHM